MKHLKRKIFKYHFLVKELFLNYPNEKRNFMRRLGYDLNLEHPKSLNERIVGRYASKKVINPETKEVIVDKNVYITDGITAIGNQNFENCKN